MGPCPTPLIFLQKEKRHTDRYEGTRPPWADERRVESDGCQPRRDLPRLLAVPEGRGEAREDFPPEVSEGAQPKHRT